eukprot:Rmarinus@m.26852
MNSRFNRFAEKYREECEKLNVSPRGFISEMAEEAESAGIEVTKLDLRGSTKPLFNQRLSPDDILAVCEALKLLCPFTELDMSYNFISGASVSVICRLLEENPPLTHLSLRGNDLDATDAMKLAQALKLNSNLRHLDLNLNKIGSSGGTAIAQLLQANMQISSLDMGNTELDVSSIVSFMTVLQGHPAITAFYVENPRISHMEEDVIVHVGRVLQVNSLLETLDLSKWRLDDEAFYILTSYLLRNNTLKRLILRCNQISCSSGKSLQRLLEGNDTIEELNLCANALHNEGAVHIGKALAVNAGLKILDIRNNGIHGKGMSALADGLLSNNTLHTLYAWEGNEFSQPSIDKFVTILEHSPALRTVDFKPYLVDETYYVAQL